MGKIAGWFSGAWKYVTSGRLKQVLLRVDSKVDAVIPVVKQIAEFFPDQKNRKISQVLAAYEHYNLEAEDWIKALPDDGKYGPALLNLATKVAAQIPALSGTSTSRIQTVIQFALELLKND
jgi:hypothetical protein